jgi:hypothetical protein
MLDRRRHLAVVQVGPRPEQPERGLRLLAGLLGGSPELGGDTAERGGDDAEHGEDDGRRDGTPLPAPCGLGALGRPLGFRLGAGELGLAQPLPLGGALGFQPLRLVRGGVDVGGLIGREARRMGGEPGLGALEQDAGQKPLDLLAAAEPRVILARLLDPRPADEKFPLLLQPAREQRPDPEDRLVGDLDTGGAVVGRDDEKAGIGEAAQQPLRELRQRIELRHVAHEAALVIDLDQRGHEGLAQRGQLLGAGIGGVERGLGGVAHHDFQRRKRAVAQRLVVDRHQHAARCISVVQLAQGERDQRQHVERLGVARDRRNQGVFGPQPGDPRRTLHDQAQPFDRHRIQQEIFEAGRKPFRSLQVGQMIGPQCQHRQRGVIGGEQRRQLLEEGGARFRGSVILKPIAL